MGGLLLSMLLLLMGVFTLSVYMTSEKKEEDEL